MNARIAKETARKFCSVHLSNEAANSLFDSEIASLFRDPATPTGDKLTNAVSEREPNDHSND